MLFQTLYLKSFAFFNSLKLTVALLLIILFGAVLGMFVDQTLTAFEHFERMEKSPLRWALFDFFELQDVYHSWWFSFVIILLALNLIGCSIERLPRIWLQISNVPKKLTDVIFSQANHKISIPVSSKEEGEQLITSLLKKWNYREESQNTTYFFHEVFRYQRVGVYIIHLSLLMIMFGSILTTNLGVSGMVFIEEGRKTDALFANGPGAMRYNHKLDFFVGCDDFRLKTFVDESPMEFESDLAVYKKGVAEPVKRQTVRVNEPLSYGGFTFYQSTYQELPGDDRVQVSIGPHGGERRLFRVRLGEAIDISSKTTFVPLEAVGDYGGLGPALKIEQREDGKVVQLFHVFRFYPDFDPLVRRGEWDVFYQGLDHKYMTGISVASTPFLSMVFVGFITIFIGMFMAFFLRHRQYYGRLQLLESGNWELSFAMNSRRSKHVTAIEFSTLKERLTHAK